MRGFRKEGQPIRRSKLLFRLFLPLLLLNVAGCGITQTTAHDPVGAVGLQPTVEDKDAGLVGIASGFNLKSYDVIVVDHFVVAPENLKDEEDKALAAEIQPLLQSEIVRHLRTLGLFTQVVNLSEGDFKQGTERVLRLEGAIARLSPGSQGLRYFVCFGAGRSKAQVEMHFVDAQSRQVVMVTADRRVGSFGIFGGESKDLLRESFDEITRGLAKFLWRLSTGEAPRAQ